MMKVGVIGAGSWGNLRRRVGNNPEGDFPDRRRRRRGFKFDTITLGPAHEFERAGADRLAFIGGGRFRIDDNGVAPAQVEQQSPLQDGLA